MARPPLPLGTAGSVSVKEARGRHRALAQFRDYDGQTRQVEAWGATPTGARRALAIKLRDRGVPSTSDVTAETRLSTLGAMLFVEWDESGKHTPQTLDAYRSAWRIVDPAVGQLRVRECTPSAVDRFLHAVTASKPGRAPHCRVVLAAALDLAVRRDALARNPVTSAAPLPVVHREIVAVPVETVQLVRQALVTYTQKPMVRGRLSPATPDCLELVVATGCRPSEILAFRVCDVDLTARPPTVAVTGTIVAVRGKPLRRQPRPKSRSGVRVLPVPAFAVEVLARRVAALGPDAQPTDLIFQTKTGKPMAQQAVNRAWRQAREDAGLTWVTFRGLRKTVATLLARQVDPQAAADQLGHGSPRISLDHYIERLRVAPDRSGALDVLAPRIVSPGFPLDSPSH